MFFVLPNFADTKLLTRNESPPMLWYAIASLTLAAAHFPLLAVGIWALAAGAHLDLLDKVMIFAGLGLFFGQISNSNAHELIHAQARPLRRLGAAIYTSMLHGHHVSAHLRVHHVHAATDADPNSARAGEGFWRYYLRTMRGEFVAGLRAENAHRSRGGRRLPLGHPYVGYVLGGIGVLSLSFAYLGGKGLAIHLGIAAYAQVQLLLSDYVQHYGLRRQIQPSGKPEPVGPQHSWNAPKWYSSAMMLNAPRHSDHHMRPGKAFFGARTGCGPDADAALFPARDGGSRAGPAAVAPGDGPPGRALAKPRVRRFGIWSLPRGRGRLMP